MIRHRCFPIRLVILMIGPPDYKSLYLHVTCRGIVIVDSVPAVSSWVVTVRFYTVVERCVVVMLWVWCFSTHILVYAASWIWYFTRLETIVMMVYFNRPAQYLSPCSSPEAKNSSKFRRLDMSQSSGGKWSGAACWEVTYVAIHLCRDLVHSNIQSVLSTRVEQRRCFLSPFHLSMDSDHTFSQNCYWFYTFLGWNLSLLCGTEMVT